MAKKICGIWEWMLNIKDGEKNMKTYYTIKSVSNEGTYYLVKNWNKNKTFWKKEEWLHDRDLYKSPNFAIRSLKRLLEIMPDYIRSDKFSVVKVDIVDFWNGTWKFTEYKNIKTVSCGNEWNPKFEIVSE